ncbi:TIGR03086 family metal-binding protein [Saccharopolyspora elongata]|uniref:TIGR03086 family metal-binding protein n=1 Tax=Saccharopolyspora elongata TaxID=2530387 RepID=UPI001404B798|nr:TIGR03086 family metal-binding protein [Saccharopolyspora elongata]
MDERTAIEPGLFGDAATLLERATCYVLGAAAAVTTARLANATPCTGWDLRMLVAHVNDSLAVVADTLVSRVPDDGEDSADPVETLRNRARVLLETCLAHPDDVHVGGLPLDGRIAAATGALEIAVHGWDIARACGRDSPIPDGLATALVRLAPMVVTEATRPFLFRPPVAWSRQAAPGERLVAYLGRNPVAGPGGGLTPRG